MTHARACKDVRGGVRRTWRPMRPQPMTPSVLPRASVPATSHHTHTALVQPTHSTYHRDDVGYLRCMRHRKGGYTRRASAQRTHELGPLPLAALEGGHRAGHAAQQVHHDGHRQLRSRGGVATRGVHHLQWTNGYTGGGGGKAVTTGREVPQAHWQHKRCADANGTCTMCSGVETKDGRCGPRARIRRWHVRVAEGEGSRESCLAQEGVRENLRVSGT